MNSLDYKIIDRLTKQGRSTWAELGSIFRLSAPAVADRVHKLEESGVIKGYTAIVDPVNVGLGIAAFISVTLDRPEQRRQFLDQIQNMAEIMECHHIAGEEDYVLKVRCPDTKRLEYLISDEIKAIPGVLKTRTTIILSTIKETSVLPLKSPTEDSK
jgi:Lrp/AsnC family leucine-responsive transcriptional regulator